MGSANPRLEQMINELGNQQESQFRKLNGIEDTARGSMDSNFEKVLNQIDDMNKQLRQQQQQLAKIQAQVDSLNINRAPYTPSPAPAPGPATAPGTPSGLQNPPTGPQGTPGTPGAASPTGTPTNFVQALNTGRQLYAQNNYPAARDMLQNALSMAKAEANPSVSKREQIQANYWLGEAAFAMKDNATAKSSFTAAINLDNTGIDAWQSFERLGDIARAEGDNAKALQDYQTILNEFQKKNAKYPGEDRVKSKISELQSGGGGTAPAESGPGAAFMQPGFSGQ